MSARESESLLRLLAALPVALARLAVRRTPAPWIGIALTLCGLCLILSPLALWVAWSTTVFKVVLAVALGALAVAIVIVVLAREDQI